ncbi:unnamed protein product, partial [Ixodes persulcatus]
MPRYEACHLQCRSTKIYGINESTCFSRMRTMHLKMSGNKVAFVFLLNTLVHFQEPSLTQDGATKSRHRNIKLASVRDATHDCHAVKQAATEKGKVKPLTCLLPSR